MKKRRIARSADPHLEREAARYEHPIASREFILQTLAEAGVPLADEELARRLAIGPAERDAFERRVAAMERDGQILRNRKGAILVATKLDLVSGRVEGHPDGYGFVIPENGADLYLDPHEMRKVLHGDRVMVRESGLDRGGCTASASFFSSSPPSGASARASSSPRRTPPARSPGRSWSPS